MFPDATTLAPAYGFQLDNQPLSASAAGLIRKGVLLAQYDPSNTDVVDYVPKLMLSSQQAGAEMGFGFPVHRMMRAWEAYGKSLQLWIVPVPQAGGAAQRAVALTVTVTTAVAGTIPLYIGGEAYPVGVTAAQTDAQIATAIAAKINSEQDCPFTAAAVDEVVTATAKAGGTFGNGYLFETLYNADEEMPGGVSLAIAEGTAGATDPDMSDALDGMGTGSESNLKYFTGGVTSNGMQSATLQACSLWNGIGNQAVGNYAPSVMRPMRFLSVSTTGDTAGLAAMTAISGANTFDRTNTIVGAPGHKTHPVELACEILGATESIAQAHAHKSAVGVPLSGYIGAASDRWTKDDTARDTAIKAGVSTTKVVDGTLTIDGLVTMYRPSTVSPANNLYRSWRNIAIGQYISKLHRDIWEPVKNKTIVEDTAEVDESELEEVMDIDAAKDLNNAWADLCQKKACIYNAEFTKSTQSVRIRDLANGFDHTLKVIYSAEGVISNTVVKGDISLAAITR